MYLYLFLTTAATKSSGTLCDGRTWGGKMTLSSLKASPFSVPDRSTSRALGMCAGSALSTTHSKNRLVRRRKHPLFKPMLWS